jgi:hypothetical protein
MCLVLIGCLLLPLLSSSEPAPVGHLHDLSLRHPTNMWRPPFRSLRRFQGLVSDQHSRRLLRCNFWLGMFHAPRYIQHPNNTHQVAEARL